MKQLSLLLLGLLFLAFKGPSLQEEASVNWMRYPAISPDGSQVAFCYKGNIYTVPSSGGAARPLTIGTVYNYKPVWSPDGKQIAFASDRHGNFDVFTMPAEGGTATRLTYHSANDIPQAFSPDGKMVYFISGRLMNPENTQFPYGRFVQLYQVPTTGERPSPALPMPLEELAVHKDGQQWLYIDLKGYEDTWRKHHMSSVTRDIWLYRAKDGSHTKLTSFEGEDRNPVWAPDGKSFYFLSEQSGTFNIWKMDPANPAGKQQVSQLKRHPVRFLSVANNATLCYGFHGEIYTQKEGEKAQKLSVTMPFDQPEMVNFEVMTSNASEMALSPDGKEIAFIVRGEVFVTAVEGGMTKRITNTPEQERNVSFSPDGKKLLYAAERKGSWNLYESSLANPADKLFYGANLISEKALLEIPAETFQPAYSPDGKEVAYLEERNTLKVLNLESGKTRTVLPGNHNYSYSDGDQHYHWSPDSKWFLVSFIDKARWVDEIGLVKADGSQAVQNLSLSGYSEDRPKWAMDGKACLYLSDREGFRSHGSWGAQTDAYLMFFDQPAYKRFTLSKEAFDLLKEQEKKEDDKKDDKKDGDKKEGDKKEGDKKDESKPEDKKEPVKDLVLELKAIHDRIVRLTLSAAFIGDFVLSPDGEKLYYTARRDNGTDLWELEIRENKVKTITNFKGGVSQMLMDSKGETLYILSNGAISQVKTSDGKMKPVSFKAEMYLDKAGERDYFFEHMWRQVDKKFYLVDLHGADWQGLKKDYAMFLPHINNSRDFAEMMSELLGELNGSHTGCRYFHSNPKGDQTAALGFFEDYNHKGPGIKIAEVMDKSPLQYASTPITAGMIIEKIDGEVIAENQNYIPMLNHKADKQVLLTVYNPADKTRKDISVAAISLGQQSELLYERWVKSRRAETERLSNGRLGYVHVRGMNSASFREVYSELLGRYNDKEAVIVDTRFNGGGWLHDDLATLLSGKQYVKLMPRGQHIGSEPQSKWQKPSVVLAGEGNYSDAHFFPVAYKALGIGPIVGMPVPGTTTAVWWETQIDPSLVFGIPQIGVVDMKGNYLENQQLMPDYQVKNMPADFMKGRDAQLEKAVELLLK